MAAKSFFLILTALFKALGSDPIKLAVVKLGIEAVEGHKLLMVTLLHDVAVLHAEDKVRISDVERR
jgi:hypothetical protein